jgi:hypothetical protein
VLDFGGNIKNRKTTDIPVSDELMIDCPGGLTFARKIKESAI